MHQRTNKRYSIIFYSIQVGRGRCRGPNWTHKRWPLIKGALTPKDCALACAKKRGCTGFDIGPMAEGVEECALYGHKENNS